MSAPLSTLTPVDPLGHEPHPEVPLHTSTAVGPGGVTLTSTQGYCRHCHQWVPVGEDAPAYRCWHRAAA